MDYPTFILRKNSEFPGVTIDENLSEETTHTYINRTVPQAVSIFIQS